MKSYKTIYFFEATEKVKDGETVYCLDRQTCSVCNVNNLSVGDFVKILNDYKSEENRYEFWVERETEEKAE